MATDTTNRKRFTVNSKHFDVSLVDGRIFVLVDDEAYILPVDEARSLVAALVAAANEANALGQIVKPPRAGCTCSPELRAAAPGIHSSHCPVLGSDGKDA